MSKPRRVLFAGLFHETHTFVEGMTGLKDFAILREEELLRCEGDSSPLGGALAAARKFGWVILPTIDFRASPSAMVEDVVIESFWKEFKERALPFFSGGVDAIYLVLHGAMVSQSLDDVEGEILERIRKLPGAAAVPIFGVFDLHANFTQRMADHSNCLVAYRENPHTDARDAAQFAATLLEKSFQTGVVPRTYWLHPALVWPPTGTATASEPMLTLEKMAREMERNSQDIWCTNVVAGFSFADMPETGVSFTICSSGPTAEARAKLKALSESAVNHRALGNATEPNIDAVMANIVLPTSGLTVLVEPSDNIGGGAPGDGTGILRALVKHRANNAAVCINDPEAVALLNGLKVGEKTTLNIGGKGSRLDAGPLPLEVELISRSNGRFELEDKKSHLASMSGNYFDMGPTAVVRHEGILILLTSIKTPPFDLGQWRSQRIEPRNLSVIGAKAAVAHRRAYDPIAKQMLWVDTPGPCSSHLKSLPYKKIKRPIYPLDPL